MRVVVRSSTTLNGRIEANAAQRSFATGSGSWKAGTSDSNPPAGADMEHQALRRDLAAAHWLTNHFRMDDLTWNHISARVPSRRADANTRAGKSSSGGSGRGSSVEFLVTPGDRLWDDVKPQDLVLSSDNVTANVIHEGIYEARSDVQAVVHLHTPSVTTVSCLASGLQLFDQDGAQFASEGAVAYHDWEGLSDDADEQSRIAAAFGPIAHTLIMRNHGACTVGSSVGQAWVRAWYLERVCRLQVSLLQLRAAGEKLLVPASDVLNHAANQVNRDFPPGRYEWDALVKFWERSAGAQSHWPAGEHTIRHGTVPDGRAHDRANRSGGRGRGRVWAGSKGDEGSVNQSFDERRGTSTAGSVVKRRRRDFFAWRLGVPWV
eukprot:INCI18822.1.p1 GENE.INCI18822.1~~INCI18822.1.p1  ORF type:complete len:418 (-),score=53.30 INCI18822.1:191-1321(-)